MKALLIKRYHLYKRDRTGLCCEVAVPFLCVLIGCLFNKIDFSQKSYTLLVEPSMYPTPQRLTLNLDVISPSDASITPQTLFSNLPGSSGDFEVTYTSAPNSFIYYENVFANRLVNATEPYRYGSYEIYKADSGNQVY